MMLLASTMLPSRPASMVLAYADVQATSLAAARACSPSLLTISTRVSITSLQFPVSNVDAWKLFLAVPEQSFGQIY